MAQKRNKKGIRPSNKRNLIAHTDPRSPVSEQYRTIRTNIQFSVVDKDIHTLMVTSAGPSEGKSTTTANLAVVFAQQGKRVLLIDADLRKPTMHYTFRLDNNIGLINVLTKQNAFVDAFHNTDIENLYVLTSGPIPPNPAEVLGSKAMDELLEKALEEFDLILFDTPPVLAVTDAQILANQCDGTVLVVNSGRTETDAIIKAKELLVSANAKLLGVVLNRKKLKENHYYYYYGN
ncbi:CpsD/CapB family tyrosine-protein kinase [Bacillus massilinigeriensis]|uniref:CpsD/CapB family tyrosine-protein kinase n=1 Tax=Bacillus massilionigeriensis TaxID=1805475 RepID=UPI00096B38E7|nr:CpsD/CapB family tyrosine-protein kinase [Bacillus massilionigeriensis]